MGTGQNAFYYSHSYFVFNFFWLVFCSNWNDGIGGSNRCRRTMQPRDPRCENRRHSRMDGRVAHSAQFRRRSASGIAQSSGQRAGLRQRARSLSRARSGAGRRPSVEWPPASPQGQYRLRSQEPVHWGGGNPRHHHARRLETLSQAQDA